MKLHDKNTILLISQSIAVEKAEADVRFMIGTALNITSITELESYRELEEFLDEVES